MPKLVVKVDHTKTKKKIQKENKILVKEKNEDRHVGFKAYGDDGETGGTKLGKNGIVEWRADTKQEAAKKQQAKEKKIYDADHKGKEHAGDNKFIQNFDKNASKGLRTIQVGAKSPRPTAARAGASRARSRRPSSTAPRAAASVGASAARTSRRQHQGDEPVARRKLATQAPRSGADARDAGTTAVQDSAQVHPSATRAAQARTTSVLAGLRILAGGAHHRLSCEAARSIVMRCSLIELHDAGL